MKRTRSNRPVRRAFTLMEIIVVVTIIALLAGLVVPRLWQNVDKARTTRAQSECAALANTVITYCLDVGRTTPSDDFEMDVLLLTPDDGGGPNGPYLQKADDLNDPWDNPYTIRIPGEINFDFDIISYGQDGQPGGEGPDADITN